MIHRKAKSMKTINNDINQTMRQKHIPYGIYEKYFKRLLDCLLALLLIFFFFPFLLSIALLVRIKLGTPVVFSQERPGLNGKIFKLYKFRTMTEERDDNGELLPDDKRLTSFGRKLRSTSLDELLELFNILKGEMSLVGPRPLLVEYLPYYTDKEKHRHDVRPGLSGLAQIHGRNAIAWEEKFAWDLQYVRKITFIGDMLIILQTIVKVINGSDVLVGKQYKAGRLDVVRETKKKSEK